MWIGGNEVGDARSMVGCATSVVNDLIRLLIREDGRGDEENRQAD